MSTDSYVQQFDQVPEFWQFLRGLRGSDLITELIQNELDAGSTYTRISFLHDRLICEGNGEPIDADGWRRLTVLLGAGDRVPRKKNRIGVKNHGLKACFVIGDQIELYSDGQFTRQTLYKDGFNAAPSPGTFPSPQPSHKAPARGCRVEVLYRTAPLVPETGEPFQFDAISEAHIERLFTDACATAANRFLGVVAPNFRKTYELSFCHFRLGEVLLHFVAKSPRTSAGHQIYRRSVEIDVNGKDSLKTVAKPIYEMAASFVVPRSVAGYREIPTFYQHRRGFKCELAWRVSQKGTMQETSGRRRYPIAYAGDDPAALTNLGVHISAPYVSDQERHAAAPESEFNDQIDDLARRALVKLLRDVLVPRHGAKALRLLYDSEHRDDQTLECVTKYLLMARALPIIRKKDASLKNQLRVERKKARRRSSFGPRRKDGETQPVIVPVFSWRHDQYSDLLAELAPRGMDLVDPDIPAPVLAVLANEELEGRTTTHVNFNEQDALKRWQKADDAYYPWADEKEWEAELSDAQHAKKYCDLLLEILKHSGSGENDAPEHLQQKIYLPDQHGQIAPISELYTSAELPKDIPLLAAPPLLAPALTKHALFRKKQWKRPKFSFADFLDCAELATAEVDKRNKFWHWLRRNGASVPRQYRVKVARLPVWRSVEGTLVMLAELCQPKDKTIRGILAPYIQQPAKQVLDIEWVAKTKKGALAIRAVPTAEELRRFLECEVGKFAADVRLSDNDCRRFRTFERHVSQLAKDKAMAKLLGDLSSFAIALSKSHHVRPTSELVRSSKLSERLQLLENDVGLQQPKELSRVPGWAIGQEPQIEHLVRALEQSPSLDQRVQVARLSKLKELLADAEDAEAIQQRVSTIPCIPVDEEIRCPRDLAFVPKEGTYWGDWKQPISARGLSAKVQRLYRWAGVLPAEPSPDLSQKYFKWLANEPDRFASHVVCVIRHLNHRHGPGSWATIWSEIPCCLAQNWDRLHLVSTRQLKLLGEHVFLPDFPELEQAIREKWNGIKLLITSHPDIKQTCTSTLVKLGARSLRAEAASARNVSCCEPGSEPEFDRLLRRLQSSKVRNELIKRLSELDVDTGQLRDDWEKRLQTISAIRLGRNIQAQYRIGRWTYWCHQSSACSLAKKAIYIDRSQSKTDSAFYDAIAQQLFFPPKRMYGPLLREAVHAPYEERQTDISKGATTTEETAGSSAKEETIEQDSGVLLGGAVPSHGGNEAEETSMAPRTTPIPDAIADQVRANEAAQHGVSVRTPTPRSATKRGSRETNAIEMEQVTNLKQQQYAGHCQACIAERSPAELAPVGSYVESPINRLGVIEAHHVDQVQQGGARHAGNILILCRRHHQRLGDELSREAVLNAIQANTKGHTIRFPDPNAPDGQQEVAGRLLSVPVTTGDQTVRLFFTEAHLEYWKRAVK